MQKNQNDLTAAMAKAAYRVSTVIAVALIWIWLALLIVGLARNAPLTYRDVLTGGLITFVLAAVIYFAGCGWRRFWPGRRDHFFTRS